jgi:hypothetical protein
MPQDQVPSAAVIMQAVSAFGVLLPVTLQVWRTCDPVGVADTGVYLYHMPMGRSGVAKADNFHGWGHRFSSFWWAIASKRIRRIFTAINNCGT